MRTVYSQAGTAPLTDQHACAIEAMVRQDAGAVRAAIQADIADGMRLLGRATLRGAEPRLTNGLVVDDCDHRSAARPARQGANASRRTARS